MLGAIIGDIVGSRFEWNNHKSKDFALFGGDGITDSGCTYTDDTVMTVAVADTLLQFDRIDNNNAEEFQRVLVERMHAYGQKRLDCGFGGNFYSWIKNGDTEPYGSCGNGSAMRVSPVGWYAKTLTDAKRIAKLTAEVTHNHPEGIKGAQAVAAAVFLARRRHLPQSRILLHILTNYYPNYIPRPLDEVRPQYEFDETCQGSVPEAILAFVEAKSFEDALRNAVSIGGDSDTIADISGAIAEAFYGIPDTMREKALSFLDEELRNVVLKFTAKYCK